MAADLGLRPPVGSSENTQFWHRPFQGLLEKAQELLNGEARDVDAPDSLHVRSDWTPPPEPTRARAARVLSLGGANAPLPAG